MEMIHEIDRLSLMAKLSLPQDEKEEAVKRLSDLTKDFDRLAEVDAAATVPMVFGIELWNVLREDVVNKTISREELLSGAPEQSDGYFQVPKTVE